MTDEQLIAEGRECVAKIQHQQLRLGQLALEYAPIGDPSVKTGQYERLREYAEAIGVDEATLRNYRATAHAWQQVEPGPLTFTAQKALISVAHKGRLVEELAKATPPTKSGRWTAPAAVDFAREHGYWSHSEAPRAAGDLVRAIRTYRGKIARLGVDELDDEQKDDVLAALRELIVEVQTLQEVLLGERVRS